MPGNYNLLQGKSIKWNSWCNNKRITSYILKFFTTSFLFALPLVAHAVPVSIDVDWPAYASENTITITGSQAGSPTIITSGTTGSASYSNTFNYNWPAGNYSIQMDDSYGDGWDGAASVTIDPTTPAFSDDGPATSTQTLPFVIVSTTPSASNGTINYPTSGNGQYQGSVAMLDWGGSGLDDGIRDGDSVSFALPGCRSGTLNATFSNISNATTAANYTVSDMQTWSGASMYTAYNGPGSGEAIHSPNNGDLTFRVNWSMVNGGVSVLPDLLVLDAESTNSSGETLGATTDGGNWSLVDSAGGTDFIVSGVGTQTFSITKSENPSNSPMLLSVDTTQTDITIGAGGRQAVAFAILLPCDYGDANGYASAFHAYNEEAASPSGLQFIAGQPYLGSSTSTPDSDTAQQDSATAEGDDNDFQGDDEGGISSFPTLGVGQASYTIPAANITASGSGTLHAWIDFNGNGIFDANEHDSVSVSSGTLSGDLSFSGYTVPNSVGTTFARFRFTSDAGVTSSTPSGTALDGEVEDYQVTITILEVDLKITKTVNDTTPNIGDIVTFSLLVENLGPDVASTVSVTDIIPAGFTYVTGSMTGGVVPSDESSPAGSGLIWTINSLTAVPAAGSSTTLTFQAVVNTP